MFFKDDEINDGFQTAGLFQRIHCVHHDMRAATETQGVWGPSVFLQGILRSEAGEWTQTFRGLPHAKLNWNLFQFCTSSLFFDTKIYKPYYCYVMLSIFLYLHLNHIHIHASELNISYPLWICILKKKIPLSLHLSNIKSSDFLSCHPSSQNPSPPWPYWRSSNSF